MGVVPPRRCLRAEPEPKKPHFGAPPALSYSDATVMTRAGAPQSPAKHSLNSWDTRNKQQKSSRTGGGQPEYT
jgi:hypothetical protein